MVFPDYHLISRSYFFSLFTAFTHFFRRQKHALACFLLNVHWCVGAVSHIEHALVRSLFL